MSKFLDKVQNCQHKNFYPDYLESGSCPTPYCGYDESHCKDCGAFIMKCGCGYNNGISGWSYRRYCAHMFKEREKPHD